MLLLVVFRRQTTRVYRVHPQFGDAAGLQGESAHDLEYMAYVYFGY